MWLLYDLFFLVFAFLYVPYLLVKGKFRRDFLQRLSFLPDNVTGLGAPVWIHAVSVGEGAIAAKLSSEIKSRYPDIPVVVSTTTKTGRDMVRKSAGRSVDAVFYYPLDIKAVVSRIVRIVKPRLYIMVETELWPNLLEELRMRKVPVVLANGRISDTSFRNYKRIGFVTKRILRCVDRFCVQTKKDAERIKRLGAPGEKVFVAGNIKFDERPPDPSGAARFSKERLGFGGGDRVIVAGSTHFPEEEAIIDAYRELKKRHDNLKLILAPRHVERKNTVRAYMDKAGLEYRFLSDILEGKRTGPGNRDVILVDTIGHLKELYGVADLIFVGGSLARKGGQNPIEAARWGKCVVFGPHMFNFGEVADIFLENGAAVRVSGAARLERTFGDLLEDHSARDRVAGRAREVIDNNSGAAARTIERIKEYL